GAEAHEKLPRIAGECVLPVMATKKERPASTSRVTRPKRASAPKRARAKVLAEDVTLVTETVPVPETVAVAETVVVAEPAVVAEPPVAMLPPPVERAIPKHPWFGEAPARLLGKFLDGWRRKIERRIVDRLPPWVARVASRYGLASMQQRKPVE